MIDIILQGPIYPNTINTANLYASLPFVDNVIISTWNNQPTYNKDSIITVTMEQPIIKNTVTMNCQIASTVNGLKYATSPIVVKMRSDQTISLDSMNIMKSYYDKSPGRIFTLGVNMKYAYHPQDHVFWGMKKDIIELFDLPMVPDELCHLDFNNTIRFPAWIGFWYMNKFFNISKYIKDIKSYFTDSGSLRSEPLNHSNEWIHKFFIPFPRLNIWWEKYKTGYWYDDYSRQGECYGN